MLDKAVDNRTQIARIKKLYDTQVIDRETAKKLAQPILDSINKQTADKTKILNKNYGMNRKPAVLDFINAMRNSY